MKALTYTQKSHTYRTLTYTQASMKYSVRCIVQTTLHCDQTLNGGIRCSPQQHLSLSLSSLLFKQSSSVSPLQFFTLVFYALCMQLSCSLFPSVTIHPFVSMISLPFLSFVLSLSLIPQSLTAGDYYTHRRNLSPPISLCLSAVFPLALSLVLPPVHSLSYSFPLILLHPYFSFTLSFPEWM